MLGFEQVGDAERSLITWVRLKHLELGGVAHHQVQGNVELCAYAQVSATSALHHVMALWVSHSGSTTDSLR